MHAMIRWMAATGLALAGTVGAASAGPGHAEDIILAVHNGRIVTGHLEDAEYHQVRVFGAEFGNLGENITDEPGFDALAGTFPVGTANGFRILRAVRVWAADEFTQIPEERIAITRSSFPPPPPAFSPLNDDEPVTGFTLPVGADGRWHYHLEFNLLAPASDGIYLLELEIFNTGGMLAPSRPFWLVLNKNVDELEHDEAIQWAQYVLAREGCPADFDRDFTVNSTDISAFITAWLAEVNAGPDGVDLADINDDGVVNSQDISAFITLWLAAVGGGC